MFNRIYGLGLLFFLLVLAYQASGQSHSGARLFPPDTQAFPRIQTYLDVYGGDSGFVHGLSAEDVRIHENGVPVPLVEFRELRPGVQVVYAINPGETFTIRNSQGLSRFDYIFNSLKQWAVARQGSTVDDLSVLITAGPVRTHTVDPAELLSTLESYQLDAAPLSPNLDTLLQALNVVSDPSPRPGMERAIHFITSPLPGDASTGEASVGLQEIILRAQQQGVRIYVWLVGSPDVSESPGFEQLRSLADSTGGEFFVFSADDVFPSPETSLSKLRNIYTLVYESSIGSGTSHQLEADVQIGDEEVSTPVLNFDFSLQPPDPAFILPAAVITRSLASAENSLWRPTSLDEMAPRQQVLPVLIDFPDGNARPLQWTRLYVDGALAAENLSPPFDQFVWDLSGYTSTRQHVLQIEALDSLGLQGKSIEMPIDIRVIKPRSNPLSYLVGNAPAVLGLIVLLGTAVVLLVLVLSGRIRPNALRVPAGAKFIRKVRPKPGINTSPKAGENDLRVDGSSQRITSWVNRLHWPQRRLSPQTYAFLVFVSEDEETTPITPISISSDEITFGRDKSLAMLVVEDPSVELLHSRMIRDLDGSYRLFDENSIAGTWVNYTPTTREGTKLEHGDLIHIGRVGFRFKLRDIKKVRKAVILRQVTDS